MSEDTKPFHLPLHSRTSAHALPTFPLLYLFHPGLTYLCLWASPYTMASANAAHSSPIDRLTDDLRLLVFLAISKHQKDDDYDYDEEEEDGKEETILSSISTVALLSRTWFSSYRTHKNYILGSIAFTGIPPSIIAAARVRSNVELSFDCPDDILNLPFELEKLRDPNADLSGNWTFTWVRDFIRRRSRMKYDARELAEHVLQRSTLIQSRGIEIEPQDSELLRFERVLYYLEIYAIAQGNRLDYINDKEGRWCAMNHPTWLKSDQEFEDLFTSVLSVVEVEQLRCIVAHLGRELSERKLIITTD